LRRITSQVRLAEVHLQKALTRYEKAMHTAVRAVSDARVEYRRIKEVCRQQEWLVNAVREQASLASMRYPGGIDILRNTLDADRNLCHTELSLVQTSRNELLALVQLYKALGGRW
jgi:multidrug efflux system outer membrane protein